MVDATLAGASAAAAATPTVNADLTYDPINASGAQDYPITSPTYIITYTKYSDAGKVALLQAFLNYILGYRPGRGRGVGPGVRSAASRASIKKLAQVSQIHDLVVPGTGEGGPGRQRSDRDRLAPVPPCAPPRPGRGRPAGPGPIAATHRSGPSTSPGAPCNAA